MYESRMLKITWNKWMKDVMSTERNKQAILTLNDARISLKGDCLFCCVNLLEY